MRTFLLNKIPVMVVIVTLFSVQPWLPLRISNTTLYWILNFTILGTILSFVIHKKNQILNQYILLIDFKIIYTYFCWLIINIIRGMIIAENYWEWKQLITGIQSLSLPLLVFIFMIPTLDKHILRLWFKYAIILLILISPFFPSSSYQFYLGPVFLIGCFLPIIPLKWRYILLGLILVMLVANLGARSQVIKSAIVLLIAIGIYFRRFITLRILKIIHWACYIIPVFLLILGFSSTFNIFEDLSSNKGKYVEKSIVNGKLVEEDLSADTRTFIYKEVIESALKHNYVIWGRTPARGNDSMSFGIFQAEELKTGKYERHSNEVCHTNVFTWLGLIGVTLYSLIYLRSSYLAIYKSKNIYIKFIGCFIALRWAYGWVEDMNNFSIMNISLWMMIAMGISIRFRSMNNLQFKKWVQNIFTNSKPKYYENRYSKQY